MQLEGVVRSCYYNKIILYIDNFEKKKLEVYTLMKMTNYLVIETNKKIEKYRDKRVRVTIKKKQGIIVDGDITVNLKYKLKSIEVLD